VALLRCDFFADTLGLSTSMTVILPQPTNSQIRMTGSAGDEPPPVLYLLHGLSDDDTIWVRRTSIERYVAPLGLAVVMPVVHRSFYADEAMGGAYWTFLTEELPSLVHRFFRLSAAPTDTFVAGLSMGGYGAWKWALRHPDRFAAAASLSGAVDLSAIAAGFDWPEDPHMFRRLFPDGRVPATDDLAALLAAANPTALPALWLSCGSEDEVYGDNRRLAEACAAAGIDVTPSWVEGGGHDWALWDTEIQQVLDWLPIRRPSED
jgi:S-formylglutathione hydrolase FrmB